MKFDDNIIYDWYKRFRFSNDELDFIERPITLGLKDTFDQELNRKFLGTLLDYGISSDYKVSVDSCATNIINKLFDKYVSDDTLVITTQCEHPSVLNNLSKCKHLFYICDDHSIYYDKINDLLSELSYYKNVFVYINTTPITSKVFVPDSVIKSIKNLLILSEINHHIVFDEVQGIYFFPRDYSIADSIISTAHAFINKQFDMGILISKTDISKFDNYGLSYYIDLINLVNKHKSTIYQYGVVMTHYYSRLLNNRKFELFNSLPYKFFIIDIDESNKINKVVSYSPKVHVDLRGLDLFNKLKKCNDGMIYSDNSIIRGIHVVRDLELSMDRIHDVNSQINERLG